MLYTDDFVLITCLFNSKTMLYRINTTTITMTRAQIDLLNSKRLAQLNGSDKSYVFCSSFCDTYGIDMTITTKTLFCYYTNYT